SGTAQLARHVYVRWVEQRASVLHRYEQPLATTIRDADPLDKLEAQYAAELKRARREAAARAAEKRPDDANFDPEATATGDPKVAALRTAITDWEAKT